MAARRVDRSGALRNDGHRTAAHWMAATTGVSSVGQAVETVETARRLDRLPGTTRAFAAGELSETQVREVASAAAADPGREAELLQAARTESVSALRDRCRRVRASATDEIQAYERIRRSRYLRHWTDPEGAFRMEAQLTPDDGATILAGLEPYQQRTFAEARTSGRSEPSEAYAADALVAMARSKINGKTGPTATVHVWVDRSAFVRGPTTVSKLARLCRWHHYLKSHHGYRLGGTAGHWTWSGPRPPPE